MEYTRLQINEQHWFHTVGLCSDVKGDKKYILVMSDRTADKKASQALEEAVHAAESANRAKSTDSAFIQRKMAFQPGMNGHISKPIDINTIMARLTVSLA